MSLINQGYKVGAPSNNLILETAGRVYVKVGDRFYEWDFRNQKPSTGSSVTNITNNISEEVDLSNYVDKSKLQTILNNYVTRREWADVKKSQQMLEQAQLEGFTESISPITVNTMQLIVGSDQLQFEFIQDKNHDNVIRHDFSVINNRIHCAAGVIKHYTLYGPGEIRPENDGVFDNLPYYYRWNVSEFNEMLFDDNKSYYLYIRAEKPSTDNDTLNRDVTNASSGKYDIKVGNATFVLSSNAIGLEDEDDYYHFLYALIGENSNGYRSTSTMNGFTEITPGQVTAYLFKSADGNSYLDFKNNQLVLKGPDDNGNHLIWQNGQLSIKGNITVSDGHNESPADLYRGAWTSGERYYNGNTVSYNDGTSTSLYKLSGVGDSGEVASNSNKPGASGSHWTLVISGGSGTSAYSVDLSNEYLAIPVVNSHPVKEWGVVVNAYAYVGTVSDTITRISNGNSWPSGINFSWTQNHSDFTITITTNANISNTVVLPVKIRSDSHSSYTTLNFTIAPVEGSFIYSIEPSSSSIKYTSGASITCNVYKQSVNGGSRTILAGMDVTGTTVNGVKNGLFYTLGTGNRDSYTYGTSISIADVDKITFEYFIDNILYDQESVPVVKDGVDGSTVYSVDISASSYIIWYADNTASTPETMSIVLNPRTNISGTGSWTFKNSSQNDWNGVDTGVSSNNVLTIDSSNIGTFFGNIAYNQGTKSCEFKYTITSGANSYSDIVNILKACSGKDGTDGSGANAVRIDLTNENAQMLYTSGGSKMTQNVYTKWSLYDGNSDVSNNISSVAISGNNVTCTLSDNTSTIPSTAITNPTTNPGTYRYIYVTGIDSNANDGYVDVTVTYNNGTDTSQHTSRFNVRKVVGKNLYELILTPDAFSVNDSTVGSSDQGSITVQIKETNGITGVETTSSTVPTGLYVYYSVNEGNPSQWTSGSISFTKISTNSIQFFLLNAAYNASTYTEHVVDAETIVVNHMSNGTNGYTTGIATLFVESATKPDWDDLFTNYKLESLTYNINSKCLTEYTINGTDHLINWVDNCATIQISQSVSLIIYKNYTENITAGNSLWVSQGPYSILSGNEDPISCIEWSPFVQAENVKINSAFVSLYRRAQSLTSSHKPKSDSNNYWTYNFVNGALDPTGSDDWSATIPSITDANPYPVWISQGVASSSNTTDVINSWSDPVKYVDSNYVFILTNSNHGLDCASNGDLIGQSQSFSTQIWAHYNKVLLGTDFTYYLQIPNDIPHCEIKVPEGVTYYTGQSTGTTDANNRTLNKYYKYAIDKNTDITFIINGDIGNVSVDSEILIYLNSDDASPYYKLTETIFKQFRGETGSKGNSVVARIFNWDDVVNNTKFYDGTELLNDGSSIYPQDYVYKAVSNGQDPPIYTYYWKCIDSHTKGTFDTDPGLNSDYWAAESSFPFVASKVLFVGNQADGWVMDEGRIYHTNGLIEFNNEGNINLNKYSIKCKMYEYDASYAGYSQDCGWEYINGAENYDYDLHDFLQEIVENCNNFLIGHALLDQSYGTFENFKYISNGLEIDPSLVFESNTFSISNISLSSNEEYIIITLYDNLLTYDDAVKFYFKTLLNNNEPVINSYIHNTTCLNSSGLTTSNIKINDGNITVANVFTANNDGAVIAKGGLDGNNWYIKADNLNIQNNTSIQNVPSYRQDIKVYEQDIKTDDFRGIVWNAPPVHLFRRNITNTETLQFPDLYFSDMGSPGGIWKCRWWILIFDGVDVKIKGVNYTGLRTGGSQYNTIVHTNINDSFTINDLYIDTNNKRVYYALRDILSNANLTNDFEKICDYSGTCETNDVSHHDLWNRNVRTYTFVKGSSVSRSNCEAKVLCCVNAGVDWNFGDNYYWFKVYAKDPILITGGAVNKQMTISSNGISSIINDNSYLIFKEDLFEVKIGNFGLKLRNNDSDSTNDGIFYTNNSWVSKTKLT